MRPRLLPTAALTALLLAALTGCTAAASEPSSNDVAGSATIVTIGDSIMSGHGLDPGQDWPTLLARQDGLTLHNLACDGAGFVAVGDCGQTFAGLVAQAVALHPSIVIIQSSSNDVDQSAIDIQRATSATISRLRAALPTARVVGLSTIWNDHSELPGEIAVSSNALRAALAARGGTYIDVGQPLEGHSELMQSDDVHPTLAGQERILQATRTALLDASIPV